MMLPLIAGTLAGFLHVISGVDHLAAIGPLAIQRPKRAWLTGILWGAGHAVGALAIGTLALLLRETVLVESITSWSERLVGITLIAIGFWGIHNAFAKRLHTHRHTHGGTTHEHIHFHDNASSKTDGFAPTHQHVHTALFVGTLHGLAGGMHFFSALPVLILSSTSAAITYLTAFGLGTVTAMVIFSSILGLFSTQFAFKGARAYQGLVCGCSGAAIIVGTVWIFL